MKSSLLDKGKVVVGITHAVQEGGIGIGSSCSADRLLDIYTVARRSF